MDIRQENGFVSLNKSFVTVFLCVLFAASDTAFPSILLQNTQHGMPDGSETVLCFCGANLMNYVEAVDDKCLMLYDGNTLEQQKGAAKMADYKIQGLANVQIFTNDIEASKKFYCDVLDFVVEEEETIEHGGGPMKTAYLKSGEHFLLTLVEYADGNPEPEMGVVNHFALLSENVHEAFEAVKAKGAKVEFEISELPMQGGFEYFCLRGPDNERVEVLEYKKK